MTAKTFIDRPILVGVISVLIVILGVIGLLQLPIEQFPDIAPPTVRVHLQSECIRQMSYLLYRDMWEVVIHLILTDLQNCIG